MMKLIFLGTGSALLSTTKISPSYLIQLDSTNAIFDMGWGVAQRIYELGFKQDDIANIIFSHYHPDHVADLIPFLHDARQALHKRKTALNLIGPVGLTKLFDSVKDLMSSLDLQNKPFEFPINLKQITEGESIEIGNQTFDFISLPHYGNHAIKFHANGKSIVLTGDTPYCEQVEILIKGVDIVILDAGHMSLSELIKLISVSGAKSFYLVHLYKQLDLKNLIEQVNNNGFKGKIILPNDKDTIDF